MTVSHQSIIAVQNRRYATKAFDRAKKISEEDWATILETARLSPSSFGLEPWKLLSVESEEVREDLKPIAWGAVASLEGADRFVIFLARKGVTYDSEHLKHISVDVKDHEFDPASPYSQMVKAHQEGEADLTDERKLFDWASKQTYIQMANMMTTAAMLDLDSCPIEGFDHKKVEAYLSEKGLLDTTQFGVSVMVGFGYRAQDITPKTRQTLEEIYQVIR